MIRAPGARTVVAAIAALTTLAGGYGAFAQIDVKAVAEIAADEIERRELPGVSIAVLDRGQLALDSGFGRADIATGIDATPATVYALGSISKQFTAAAILRLVERGAVHLDQPITSHLANGPPAWRPIKVHHLLSQTSGLREFLTLPAFQRSANDLSRPASELFAMIATEPLDFVPGERWAYSNSNYTLLALIVEAVTDMPYERFLQRELFDPLGLTSLHQCPAAMPSSPQQAGTQAPAYARGYRLERGTLAPSPPENMSWARGDGGLCGTAGDLVRWSRALAQGGALSAESYRRMITTDRTADGLVPDYGFGLSLVPLDGRIARVSHHGEMLGSSGMLSYYPERDLAIAVLVNRGGALPEVIEKRIARKILDLAPFTTTARGDADSARDREASTPRSEEVNPFTGEWDIGIADFPVRVIAGSRGLRLEMPPPGFSDDLIPLGDGLFAAASEPDAVQVRFDSFPAGAKPDRMRLLMAEMHWYGRRLR